MHLLGQLQDEETPLTSKKFDGDQTKHPDRSMSELYEEYFTANPSIIDHTFTGINRSVVECGNCSYESVMFKPFSVLSLQFESNIGLSLKRLFEVSQFDADNLYKCEKCSKKTKAKHYIQMCMLPEVLVFHIKRFEIMGAKKSGFFEYRRSIDLSSHIDPADNVYNLSTKYQLVSLTVHQGSSNHRGHYLAYT
jgi:ubiquitin C-terminal hydrolase